MKKTFPVDALKCGAMQALWAVYPDDNGTYPLISFAHGLYAWYVPGAYSTLLEKIASAGYVVIATMSGYDWCDEESDDQPWAIWWAGQEDELRVHIDWSKCKGVVGHSMGGGATTGSASNMVAIALNVQAAAAMHPVWRPWC